MKESIPILLIFLLSWSPSYSQNLIWNGGFEYFPFMVDVKAKYTTDSTENWGNFGINRLHVNNYCGGKSYSGIAFIDLRLFSKNVRNCRDYAEAKITCPLIKGERYILSFRTLPIKGKYLIGNIGAYLSEKPLDISTRKLLSFTPTIISARGKAIDNTKDYTLIADTITANGGEQYITIGNFYSDQKTLVKKSDFDTVYKYYSSIYAFDDVELIPLNPKECPQASMKPMIISDTVNHVDTVFSLTDIHFATNSAEPLGECGGVLRIVQMLLARDSSLSVKISGYTDLTGNSEYNYDLSLKRAASIGRQLSALGVDCKKIFLAGYGAKNPVEGTKGESLINRRVELNIAPTEKLEWAHSKALCN